MTLDDVWRTREEVTAVDDREVHRLPVADIQPSPNNPRRVFDGIAELAASMQEHGLLQPVVVRRIGSDGYELIAGHRRLEAARTLGWSEIAAAVRDDSGEQAYILTLVENLQREDLSPQEEASALEVLVRERGWSTRQVGEAIKKSPMYVSRRLRVFDDPVLREPVLSKQIAVSTAEELLRAPEAVRPQLASAAAAEQWTPAAARRQVAASGRNESLQRGPRPRLLSRIKQLADELADVAPESLSGDARREAVRLLSVLSNLVAPHAERVH